MIGSARIAITAGVVVAMATGARAQPADGTAETPWRMALGYSVGSVLFDDHLGDYRWDTRPARSWGGEVSIERGRLGAALRGWRAGTTQASGIPGEAIAPRVSLTGVEMVGRARLARVGAFGLWGSAHGGRVHVGYDPDRLTFNTGGVAGEVTVDYAPIDEWSYGFGMEVRAPVTGPIGATLAADRSSMSLDTAHRRGDEIIASRERFSNWAFRLQLAWMTGTR